MNPHIPVITIDAKGKVLGRLASEIAFLLTDKNNVAWRPHAVIPKKIMVKNAGAIVLTGQKMRTKVYHHHSGYLGGLKTEKLSEIFKKNPSDVLRRAVDGMLPKNRLREPRLKQLEIHN